jgi:DNA-binding NtrC family response regulator
VKQAILLVNGSDAESDAVIEETAGAEDLRLFRASETEACRALGDHLHHLGAVIIDLNGGRAAVNLLRAIAEFEANPPVVVLAGAEELDALPLARKYGAAACLRKPLTAEKLLSVLEQLAATEAHEQSWTCDVWGHPHRRLICTPER